MKKFTVYFYWDHVDYIGQCEIDAPTAEEAERIAYGITGEIDLIDNDGEHFRGDMPLPVYCTV